VQLAESFFGAGYENVLIAGNAIHDAVDLNPVLPDVLRLSRVFHLSLEPSEEAVLRRTAADADRSPAHLISDLRLLRTKRSSWSIPVDNSVLSPLETLQKIAHLVQSGKGEIHGPLPHSS
jgi:chloramphenicol 3-O-phosphotransferase